jgi:hypothetical protein
MGTPLSAKMHNVPGQREVVLRRGSRFCVPGGGLAPFRLNS